MDHGAPQPQESALLPGWQSWRRWVLIVAAVVAILPPLYLTISYVWACQPDLHTVTTRFVSALRAGDGLVFPLRGVTLTTYPLYPVLASVLGTGNAAVLVPALALLFAAWMMVRLSGRGILAGVALFAALWAQGDPAMLLMLALALAAADAARLGRWATAGVLAGLAILAAPQAIPLAVLLVALAFREKGAVWRYTLPAALIPAVVLGALVTLTPATRIVSIAPGQWWLALAAVAGAVLLWQLWRRETLPPIQGVLVAWSAVDALLALGAGRLPTEAFIPGAILLIMSLRPRQIGLALALVAVTANTALRINFTLWAPCSVVDAQTPGASMANRLEWLAPPDSVTATDQIAVLAYSQSAQNIDLSGVLGGGPPDPFFIAREAPDFIVDHPALPGRENLGAGLAAFYTSEATNARETGDLTIYRRSVPLAPVDDHAAEVNFSARVGRDDLRLVGVGIGDTLRPGELVRVRLDWQLAYVPAYEVEIKLDLLTPEFAGVGGAQDRIAPSDWQTGRFSTYHAFVLSPDAAPGPVSLYLNVGLRAATMGIVKVADVQVGPP